jgi:hypothetical protein
MTDDGADIDYEMSTVAGDGDSGGPLCDEGSP